MTLKIDPFVKVTGENFFFESRFIFLKSSKDYRIEEFQRCNKTEVNVNVDK